MWSTASCTPIRTLPDRAGRGGRAPVLSRLGIDLGGLRFGRSSRGIGKAQVPWALRARLMSGADARRVPLGLMRADAHGLVVAPRGLAPLQSLRTSPGA